MASPCLLASPALQGGWTMLNPSEDGGTLAQVVMGWELTCPVLNPFSSLPAPAGGHHELVVVLGKWGCHRGLVSL